MAISIRNFFSNHKFAVKWIGIAFAVRAVQFIIIGLLLYENWPREFITNYIFVGSGDTTGYYSPVESFVDTGTYNSFCRMPGLLPIYGPLYYLFGAVIGKTLVIIFQFIVSTLSVYFLSRIAESIFNSRKAFYYTFFLYAISTFNSNWDHYGLTDSLGVSTLIFSTYALCVYKQDRLKKNIFLSGLLLAGSIFFRPVHIVLLPVFLFFFIADIKNIHRSILHSFIFCSPILIFLSAWAFANYSKYGKIIFLQGPFEECFGALTKEHLAIRKLIIAWGGDYQPWSKGSEAEWFFKNNDSGSDRNAIDPSFFTEAYNYDSLNILRHNYKRFIGNPTDGIKKELLSLSILRTADTYVSSFKKEHMFKFYFFSKIRILKQLLLPSRLDDFPTPEFSKMKFYHVLLKGFYYLFFISVNVCGFIGCILGLLKRNWWSVFPLTLLVTLAVVLGFVEQRYLTPVFPFFLIFCFATFSVILKKKSMPDKYL